MRPGAVAVALISCVAGFRTRRSNQTKKYIAGVPVTNYHLANGGRAINPRLAATSYKEDWLVTVSKQTSNNDVNNLCARAHGACKMVGHPKGGAPVFELSGTEAELEKVLSAAPGMAQTIEPDVKVRIINPAELENDFRAGYAGWNVGAVGKDSRLTTGKGVHVYVVDSGMRTSHAEFAGRAIPTLDMSTGQPQGQVITKECKGDDRCGRDDIGHGTHCAGTVGGNTYGLATDSLLHNVKMAFGEGDTVFSYAIAAMDWIMLKGKRPAVVSASWGAMMRSPALLTTVGSVVEEGIIFINAAGNDGKDACNYSPGMTPDSFTIGATTSENARAEYSNWGTCVDFWAPGHKILSADAFSPYAGTTKSGTSMAAPLVSGAAALLLQSQPNMSPAALKAKLVSNAVKDSLKGLLTGDTNLLLWAGAPWAKPAPGGTPPPCRRRYFSC